MCTHSLFVSFKQTRSVLMCVFQWKYGSPGAYRCCFLPAIYQVVLTGIYVFLWICYCPLSEEGQRHFHDSCHTMVINDILNFTIALWYVPITTNMKHLKLTAKEYLIALISTKWSKNIILNMIEYYKFFLTFGLIFSQ